MVLYLLIDSEVLLDDNVTLLSYYTSPSSYETPLVDPEANTNGEELPSDAPDSTDRSNTITISRLVCACVHALTSKR